MVGQRCRLNDSYIGGRITRKKKREGTIVNEARNKRSWYVRWDGNKTYVNISKKWVDITSNVADVVNSILIHKLKSNGITSKTEEKV